MRVDTDLLALLDHGAAIVRVAKHGKQPVGKAWNEHATASIDAASDWISRGYNVGILLGHGSLIDLEHDDDSGRKTLERLGLADAETPTYTSCRGIHRIFRLADPLPLCGWRKLDGLEIRLGGRPAQSVLPPSLHPFGTTYRWTISPRDCEPALVSLTDLSLESLSCP